ncbi:hypothetical protein FVEN_g6489 [Fusarium venenatum]|uniref:Uncharacterized protein n=1 Tax=Fusarium venenatum TaxID=56646 RepID=A0A2L2SV31_9HYPO|nr:uncharacterized protein FVRRES_04764 [Fusarium venenatum]KAG8355730.1 hypothetical protein FVEN_g6489 [Fusarium venenatum]KAH6991914.1 hypothetical protein EDB82DRAFT_123527 [Fusarium venenatum]CEI60328.1 unnamed protein product [Fusarium venenatum]
MNVDKLSEELTALLSQHFHIVATDSQRHDQWYKRSYQSFTSEHGDQKPLILVPKDSREEWVPHMRQFAASLGKQLKKTGNKRKPTDNIPESKLFLDNVLDEAHTRPLCLGITDSKPLFPDMMQMSWWTNKIHHPEDKHRRRKGIKALIACGQVDSLVRLATWPKTHPGEVDHIRSYQWNVLNNGWQATTDKIIVIMLFIGITRTFTEDLIAKDGYKYWAPVVFLNYKSPLKGYIEALGGKIPATDAQRRQQMTHCIQALRAAQSWAVSSESLIDWEETITDMFLYMLGFEAWNQGREGEGYLACDLNKTKTAKSLQGVGQGDEEEEDVSADDDEGNPKKPIDPLNLRDPKKETVPEPREEEQQQMDELAVLESAEAEYGRKRSDKYKGKKK